MHFKIRLMTVCSILLVLGAGFGVFRWLASDRPEVVDAPASAAPSPVSPAVAGSRLVEAIRTRLEERAIEFERGTANPTAAARGALSEVAELMAAHPTAALRIDAYTDARGSAVLNQGMSHARAKAVRAVLIEAGIEEHRLVAFGRGAGDAAGDRVEFAALRGTDPDSVQAAGDAPEEGDAAPAHSG